MKQEFNASYRKYNSNEPLICGTVVNHALGQPLFDRKLKMIKAPIFGLTELLNSDEYLTHKDQGDIIQDSLETCL